MHNSQTRPKLHLNVIASLLVLLQATQTLAAEKFVRFGLEVGTTTNPRPGASTGRIIKGHPATYVGRVSDGKLISLGDGDYTITTVNGTVITNSKQFVDVVAKSLPLMTFGAFNQRTGRPDLYVAVLLTKPFTAESVAPRKKAFAEWFASFRKGLLAPQAGPSQSPRSVGPTPQQIAADVQRTQAELQAKEAQLRATEGPSRIPIASAIAILEFRLADLRFQLSASK